jgi:hypothetical protein
MHKMTGEIVQKASFGAGPTVGTSVRFRAANGAVVTVTMDHVGAAQSREQVLAIAREAVGQIASAEVIHAPEIRHGRAELDDCGAAFWSWAIPAA